MKTEIKIAMVGLDTSHAPAFTRMLNDPSDPHYLPGGRVVNAWPGGSPDFELSHSRVDQFTEEVRQQGVTICESIEEAAQGCDAILLESADGRGHLEQFKKLIPFGIPVFIDKPLTCSLPEAEELARLATEHTIPVMSSSSLRFLQGLRKTAAECKNRITELELRGPLAFQETQTGYFWYGMHTIEMMFAVLGPELRLQKVKCTEQADRISACRPDNVTARLELGKGIKTFSGTLICGSERIALPSSDTVEEPIYRSLMKEVLPFFQTGTPAVGLTETLKLMDFVETANKLRLENSGEFE